MGGSRRSRAASVWQLFPLIPALSVQGPSYPMQAANALPRVFRSTSTLIEPGHKSRAVRSEHNKLYRSQQKRPSVIDPVVSPPPAAECLMKRSSGRLGQNQLVGRHFESHGTRTFAAGRLRLFNTMCCGMHLFRNPSSVDWCSASWQDIMLALLRLT